MTGWSGERLEALRRRPVLGRGAAALGTVTEVLFEPREGRGWIAIETGRAVVIAPLNGTAVTTEAVLLLWRQRKSEPSQNASTPDAVSSSASTAVTTTRPPPEQGSAPARRLRKGARSETRLRSGGCGEQAHLGVTHRRDRLAPFPVGTERFLARSLSPLFGVDR